MSVFEVGLKREDVFTELLFKDYDAFLRAVFEHFKEVLNFH